MAVISVTEVTPIPEHADVVEQAVVKNVVSVPVTRFVPLQLAIAVWVQVRVIPVCLVIPAPEQALVDVQEVTDVSVTVPDMWLVMSQLGIALALQELLDDEDSDDFGSSGSSSFGGGGWGGKVAGSGNTEKLIHVGSFPFGTGKVT